MKCDGETVARILLEHTPTARLEEFVASYARSRLRGGLFELMVAVVLSQNTSDRNALRALMNLLRVLGELTPRRILEAREEDLLEAVKPAGLASRRIRTLRELARFFIENKGLEESICRMSVEDARRLLMRVKGVGPKTVDVVLMNYCGFDVFPVDTHISRILERWGVRGGYEAKRRWAEKFFPRWALRAAHILLIQFGRVYCKARSPRCDICPLRECCPETGGVSGDK